MKKSKGYKVVLNSCFGGFGLSKDAIQMLIDKYGLDIDSDYGYVDNDDFGIVDDNYEAYRMDKKSTNKKLVVSKRLEARV